MPHAAVVHICALRCSVASLYFTARRMLQYNLGALGWQLPPDDMAQLSSIGKQIKYFDGEGEERTAVLPVKHKQQELSVECASAALHTDSTHAAAHVSLLWV